jgi:G3E family GTPase
MKVILIGGFLGSGKTSTVLQLARYLVGDQPVTDTKVVIIENEIGEVGIDDQVLAGAGYDVKGLFSGCACCTISGELIITMRNIEQQLNPEYVIMEATGVAYPDGIKEVLDEGYQNQLPIKVCCLADASRWKRMVIPLKNVIEPQLEGADIILINKTDLVTAEVLSDVDNSIKSFNGDAAVYHISALQPIDTAIWDQLA